MNAVDTNVLVYSIDRRELVKRKQAHELLRRLIRADDTPRLLWQVAGELLSCLCRWELDRKIKSADSIAYLNRFRRIFPLVLPAPGILDLAAELRSRYSLSHWDSMLLAACVEAEIDTLYSEDLSSGTTYDTVKVINPFV